MSNVAIILGAGNGTRMKSEMSKLLLTIDGKTVLQRSVEAFLSVSDIDEVVITARQQDIEAFAEVIDDERVTFVIGGDTRQQSVANAIDTIDEAQLIAIHDGARPLVTPRVIEDTLRAATEYGAAATGVMVKDTIKVIDGDGFVVTTPARATLFAVQTPQIFDFALYKEALELAKNNSKDFTDDCQLIEYYNKPVKMVVGDYSNIKITTPEDIPLAENILHSR
ncbi:MAG: 2-C-methyl-D-erythritol 4-phosphate cytidylyltransferase [Eubacterium sp.]